MRQKIVIGNWKMNKDRNETIAFLNSFKNKEFQTRANLVYGIAFPFINIPSVYDEKIKDLKIASQDISCHDSGAYTGETSAKMLLAFNVTYAIVGHSERRQYHNETSTIVNNKAHNALKNNIVPIICVGETLTEYEQGLSEEVVKKQITESTKNLDYTKIVIAYEPVWAIGTGKTATIEYAQQMCALIRKLTSPQTLIQYGGSVNGNNINQLLSQPDIDGALVGGASLEPDSFIELIKKY